MDEIKELKARAYDILAQTEHLQKELSNVNRAIAEAYEKLKLAPPITTEEEVPFIVE